MTENEELEALCSEAEGVTSRLVGKIQEIKSMMKNGEFIVAYEKVGGVEKVLHQLGVRLQSYAATKPK